MSKANIETVRELYNRFAKGDGAGVLALLDADVVWIEADNFPYADKSPYKGPQAVAAGVFGRIVAEWNGWAVEPEELLDAGDKIVALGRYSAVNKKTGKRINAQMVHVWALANGKIVRFQQYADTLAVARAMEG